MSNICTLFTLAHHILPIGHDTVLMKLVSLNSPMILPDHSVYPDCLHVWVTGKKRLVAESYTSVTSKRKWCGHYSPPDNFDSGCPELKFFPECREVASHLERASKLHLYLSSSSLGLKEMASGIFTASQYIGFF